MCQIANHWNDLEQRIRHSHSERAIRANRQQQDRIRAQAAGFQHMLFRTDEGLLDVAKCERCEERRRVVLRRFRREQFDREFDEIVARYAYRLEEARTFATRELAKIENGEYKDVSNSEWRSTAALELPMLASQIQTMVKARRAFDGNDD